MEHVARIVVYGNPRAQGSKRSQVIYRKGKNGKPVPVTTPDGRIVTRTREMAEGLEDWRTSIAQRTVEQYDGPVIDGPVRVDLQFMVVRPTTHYGSGKNADRLKDSAPLYVEKSPDLDKLVRGVMDGLKGVLYADDRYFFTGTVEKVWVDRTERPGVRIAVWRPTLRTVGDQRAQDESDRQPPLTPHAVA
jgi:Holliday junction resolvase RusA-like endonuclease